MATIIACHVFALSGDHTVAMACSCPLVVGELRFERATPAAYETLRGAHLWKPVACLLSADLTFDAPFFRCSELQILQGNK